MTAAQLASLESKIRHEPDDVTLGLVVYQFVPANDKPDAVDDKVSAIAETKVLINVLANDTDPDFADPGSKEKLTVTSVGIAANGIAGLGRDGIVSYIPNANFVGTDSFTYTITDSGGRTDTARVTVIVGGDHDLHATDDAFKVNDNTLANPIDVLANDFDPDVPPNAFKVTAITQGSNGFVEIGPNGGNVLYTPQPNFVGNDTSTYTITDTEGTIDTAKVTVTVFDAGDPPRRSR